MQPTASTDPQWQTKAQDCFFASVFLLPTRRIEKYLRCPSHTFADLHIEVASCLRFSSEWATPCLTSLRRLTRICWTSTGCGCSPAPRLLQNVTQPRAYITAMRAARERKSDPGRREALAAVRGAPVTYMSWLPAWVPRGQRPRAPPSPSTRFPVKQSNITRTNHFPELLEMLSVNTATPLARTTGAGASMIPRRRDVLAPHHMTSQPHMSSRPHTPATVPQPAHTYAPVQELAARPDVQYIAGGATQNSIRVAQWMLQEAGQTAYFGCVGSDKYAETMRAVCAKDGIAVHYMVDSLATGTCAVCVVDDDRSLVANLAAANNYKVPALRLPLPMSHCQHPLAHLPLGPSSSLRAACWARFMRLVCAHAAGVHAQISTCGHATQPCCLDPSCCTACRCMPTNSHQLQECILVAVTAGRSRSVEQGASKCSLSTCLHQFLRGSTEREVAPAGGAPPGGRARSCHG